MSSLTEIEKRYLEKILGMHSGWVLDYTDPTFAAFFKRYQIDIHSQRYQTYGQSKAKKMRAFWEQEPDALVARVLSEMLAAYVATCELNDREPDHPILDKCEKVVARLTGDSECAKNTETVDSFLHQEFIVPNLNRLPVEPQVALIIAERLEEARKALSSGASLSVIFLCGSVLEGVLLGVAQQHPAQFNRATSSAKTSEGKVKPFHEWSLAQLIDTGHEVGLLGLDIKKFSHGLRDFRNYIHPYEQMASRFTPDQHTAKVCFQVLKAALAGLTGAR
jgi:hypothetical protein